MFQGLILENSAGELSCNGESNFTLKLQIVPVKCSMTS